MEVVEQKSDNIKVSNCREVKDSDYWEEADWLDNKEVTRNLKKDCFIGEKVDSWCEAINM